MSYGPCAAHGSPDEPERAISPTREPTRAARHRDGTAGQSSSPRRCANTPDLERFDCSFNVYFDTRTEIVEPYLGGNWNVGGAENRFLRFGY